MIGGFEMELLSRMLKDYLKADKKGKSMLLSEYCSLTGIGRDAAIKRFLRYRFPSRFKKPRSFKRKKFYDSYCKSLVFDIWLLSGMICAERIIEHRGIYISQLLKDPSYQKKHGEETIEKVEKMSLSTLKRMISSFPKPSYRKHKGKSDLYKAIETEANFGKYARKKPGYVEIDYVEHKGDGNFSPFALTGNYTDVYSQWISRSAALGKGRDAIEEIHRCALKKIPFKITRFHPDNEKAILSHLNKKRQKEDFSLSRSRPYKKNDNAHVEQKNGDKIRKLVGYHRYDQPYQVYLLNRIYAVSDIIENYFTPSMKLKAVMKDGKGRVVRKIYEKAKTPYQRITESRKVGKGVKEKLEKFYEKLNLVELRKELNVLLSRLNETLSGKKKENLTDKINELTMPHKKHFTDILK